MITREIPRFLAVMGGVVLFALLFFTLGVRDADRWYAKNWIPRSQLEHPPTVQKWVTMGNENELESKGRVYAIGNNMQVFGEDVVGISCIRETSGSIVYGIYEDSVIVLVCDGRTHSWIERLAKP